MNNNKTPIVSGFFSTISLASGAYTIIAELNKNTLYAVIILSISLVVAFLPWIPLILKRRKEKKTISKQIKKTNALQIITIILVLGLLIISFVGRDNILGWFTTNPPTDVPDPGTIVTEPIVTEPVVTEPIVTEIPANTSSISIDTWFNDQLGNHNLELEEITPNLECEYVDYNITINKETTQHISVYSSIDMEDKDYGYINNYEQIRIFKIVKTSKSVKNPFIALIDYKIGNTSKRKAGYIYLNHLFGNITTEPTKQKTYQSTSYFDKPQYSMRINHNEHLKAGVTVYLLNKINNWQQIMYCSEGGQWYIKWVNSEELSDTFIGTLTVKESSAAVRSKPVKPKNKDNTVETVYQNETYTIREESTNTKEPWYRIYARGKEGWICKTEVSVEIKQK